MARKKIVVAGPMPPPTHGMSHNLRMVANALGTQIEVLEIDNSPGEAPRGLAYHSRRTVRTIRGLYAIGCKAKPGFTLYLAMESGLGRLYVLALVALARLMGARTVIHHDSYSYIQRAERLQAFIYKVTGESMHVFLCQDMALRHTRLYGRMPYRIVSNLAFLPADNEKRSRGSHSAVTVGMFGNLNREKGLFTFLEVMDILKETTGTSQTIEFAVAGTLDAESRTALLSRTDSSQFYFGAAYGSDKYDFLSSVDFLLFPSTYKVEAQPNVLFEAMSVGALPVALARGCIAEDLNALGGYVFGDSTTFIEESCALIRGSTRMEIESQSQLLRGRLFAGAQRARDDLASLVDWMLNSELV